MGIRLVIMLGTLFGNEQIKTAFYLERPSHQIQIQQQVLIEQMESNKDEILKTLEGLKK